MLKAACFEVEEEFVEAEHEYSDLENTLLQELSQHQLDD